MGLGLLGAPAHKNQTINPPVEPGIRIKKFFYRSRRVVVDKSLTLYSGVLSSIHGPTSLSKETFSYGSSYVRMFVWRVELFGQDSWCSTIPRAVYGSDVRYIPINNCM